MAGEKGGEKETSRIIGNPGYSIDIDISHGLYRCADSIGMSRPVPCAVVDPNDSADSSDVAAPGRGISNPQGTPLTSSRKRRKQLRPNKSLSLLADLGEVSQHSTPAPSPPHVMETQEKSANVVPPIREEDEEEEDKDRCEEESVMEASTNPSPSKETVGHEAKVTMKKKPKKSEVEILFSSMTTVEMAALHVRNRTQDDVWYSPRKESTSNSFAGTPIPVSPTRTAAAVSKVINEVNLSRNPRGKTAQTPTVRLPKVSTTSLLQSGHKYSAVADQSSARSRPKRTQRTAEKRNKEPAMPTTGEDSTAPASSSPSSADNVSTNSIHSSNRAAPVPVAGSSSTEPRPTLPVSTRHLPSAKSFKATFSFDEMFCKHPPAITLKDGELVPVHSMAVPYHAKVPQDHYLRRWKINRRKPGVVGTSSAQSSS